MITNLVTIHFLYFYNVTGTGILLWHNQYLYNSIQKLQLNIATTSSGNSLNFCFQYTGGLKTKHTEVQCAKKRMSTHTVNEAQATCNKNSMKLVCKNGLQKTSLPPPKKKRISQKV